MVCSVSYVWCACVRVCKSVRVHVRVCILKQLCIFVACVHVCACDWLKYDTVCIVVAQTLGCTGSKIPWGSGRPQSRFRQSMADSKLTGQGLVVAASAFRAK